MMMASIPKCIRFVFAQWYRHRFMNVGTGLAAELERVERMQKYFNYLDLA